jgi:hypothetical protein
MVEKPSHVKQLSLNHVCKIRLKKAIMFNVVWNMLNTPLNRQLTQQKCLPPPSLSLSLSSFMRQVEVMGRAAISSQRG